MPEPNFVSMAQMPESYMSEEGDDDKVYLFFSETAVECDCYNKLVVSRVARVCKVNKSLSCIHLFVAAPFPKTTIPYKQHFLSGAHTALSCCLIVHPVCLRVFPLINVGIMGSSCAHRGISEVKGPCRRNGHPS